MFMVHRNQRLPLVGKNKFLWKKVNKSNPHQLYLIADGLKFRVLISTPVENDDFKTRDFSSLVEWVGSGVNNVHRSNCNQELRICYMYEKSRLHFIKMCQSKIQITNPSSNCLKKCSSFIQLQDSSAVKIATLHCLNSVLDLDL